LSWEIGRFWVAYCHRMMWREMRPLVTAANTSKSDRLRSGSSNLFQLESVHIPSIMCESEFYSRMGLPRKSSIVTCVLDFLGSSFWPPRPFLKPRKILLELLISKSFSRAIDRKYLSFYTWLSWGMASLPWKADGERTPFMRLELTPNKRFLVSKFSL
jgi:hypothetical protein